MMSRWTVLCSTLFFFIIGGRGESIRCSNVTTFSTQLDLLLAEYDRAELPAEPIMVKAGLDVQHATIQDKSASVRLLAALHLTWEDKRLAWNASTWGCDSALTSSERLWLPRLNLLNAVTYGNAAGEGLRARIFSDGRVSWVLRFDVTTHISLALRSWPKDVQEAVFNFGPQYLSPEFNLTIDFMHATVFESGSWELLSVLGSQSIWRDEPVVAWTVMLKRRAAAHLLAADAVLAACVLLLISATLLPPASRSPLCATTAFIATLWLISALVRLPGAVGAPLAMSLMCVICIASALTAVCAALVLRVANCSSPPPGALRSLVTMTSVFCKLTPPEGSGAEWSAWAAAAKLLDHVLIATLLFTLFVVVCIYLSV